MTDPTADLAAQMLALNHLLSQLVQFTSHVGTGAMTAHVIEWLKDRPVLSKFWALLSDRGKVIWCLVVAALPAAGITITFIHSPDHPGQYGAIIDNLTWMTAAKFVWSLSQNWVFQQGWYQSIIKPKPVTGVTPSIGKPEPQPVPVSVEGVRS